LRLPFSKKKNQHAEHNRTGILTGSTSYATVAHWLNFIPRRASEMKDRGKVLTKSPAQDSTGFYIAVC
jgi:hypothetical protein